MYATSGILAATVAIGFGAACAWADDSSSADASANQQMQQKIDQLESKVQTLEAQQTQTSTDDTATLQQIQSAADTQSKLMSVGTGMTGYDPASGFNISSDDGNFLLHPWILAQFRGTFNDRQSVQTFDDGLYPGGGAADPQTGSGEHDGFEIHHLMIGLDGHVLTPLLQYFVMIDVPSSGGTETLQDAYATYRCSEDSCFGVKAGQFIDPVWHESNVDDGHLMAVDRSLVGALLGGNTGVNDDAERTQGVGITYQHGCMRGEVDLTDGRDTANTPFYDVSTNGFLPRQNFGMSARVEYKVMGDDAAWNGYNSLSAYGVKSDLLVLGGGLEWDEASNFDNIYATVDGQYTTTCGLSFYGALLEDYADWSDTSSAFPQTALNAAAAGSYPNFGCIFQVGYRIKPTVEPFFRYDVAVLNSRYAAILAFGNKEPGGDARATANNHEFTAGVNYYLFGYRAKVCGDISFLPNGSVIDAPGLGIFANQEHSEWVGRLQFQLAI
jgi:outer membrane murein-binding lipoprotein Lpp